MTATTSTQCKIDFLLTMPNGATHGVNYKTQDFAEEVKKNTGGKGADVTIDFVGQSHWKQNVEALAVDGRMTMLGLLSGWSCFFRPYDGDLPNRKCPGRTVKDFDLFPVLCKRLRIQGSTLRTRSYEYQAELIAKLVSPCFIRRWTCDTD